MATKSCISCGLVINADAIKCPYCGKQQPMTEKERALEDHNKTIRSGLFARKRKVEETTVVRNETEDFNSKFEPVLHGSTYRVKGARGRIIDIYPNKCRISYEDEWVKTIYYFDCVGLHIKYPNQSFGFIQFETSAGLMALNETLKDIQLYNENAFIYTYQEVSKQEINKIYEYIVSRLDDIKSNTTNQESV